MSPACHANGVQTEDSQEHVGAVAPPDLPHASQEPSEWQSECELQSTSVLHTGAHAHVVPSVWQILVREPQSSDAQAFTKNIVVRKVAKTTLIE
jgi:hypothetical protein